jgi:hypothetical protein
MCIVLPIAARTDADKRAYCLRALERLRLWHNARSAQVNKRDEPDMLRFEYWRATEFNPRQASVFGRLDSLRDLRMPYDEESDEAKALYANRVAEKRAGAADSSWDAWVDVEKLPRIGAQDLHIDPYEDYTTYTETDTGGYLTVDSATKVSVVNAPRNTDWLMSKDFGARYWNANVSFRVDSIVSDGDDAGIIFPIIMTTYSGTQDFYHMFANGYSLLGFRIGKIAGPSSRTVLHEVYGAGLQQTDYWDDAFNVRRYYQMRHDRSIGSYGRVYMDTYSDAAFSSLLDTLTILMQAASAYRSIMSCVCYGGTSSYRVTGDVQHLDLAPVSFKGAWTRKQCHILGGGLR